MTRSGASPPGSTKHPSAEAWSPSRKTIDGLGKRFSFAMIPSIRPALAAPRLCTFLIVTVRFYMGSVEFFDTAHTGPESQSTNEAYAIDFVFGLFHFMLFFVWATTIEVSKRLDMPFGTFLIILGMILLYDVPWCLLRSGPQNKVVALWSLVNTITVVFALVAYLIGVLIRPDLSDRWEIIALSIVVFFSILDLWGILLDDPVFPKWLGNFIPTARQI